LASVVLDLVDHQFFDIYRLISEKKQDGLNVENLISWKKANSSLFKEIIGFTVKARMNLFKIISFYIMTFILFEFLFLIPSSFSYQKATISKENEDYLPSLSLIGVMVSKDTSSSVAVLRNEKTGKTKVLSIGESIFGLKLVRVFENRIILQGGERTYKIFLARSNLISVAEKIQKDPGEISITDWKDDPLENNQLNLLENNQLNNNLIKKEFIRSEVERRMEREWPLIIEKAAFVPNLVDGKINGFKITNLPEKTILSEIGIYKNDVIKEVDGIELNDFATLFELFNKFKEKNQFEVCIERNGKLLRLLYILK